MAKRNRKSLGYVEKSSAIYKLIVMIMRIKGFEKPLEAVEFALEREAKRQKITLSSNG